jgi:hypothetical protein
MRRPQAVARRLERRVRPHWWRKPELQAGATRVGPDNACLCAMVATLPERRNCGKEMLRGQPPKNGWPAAVVIRSGSWETAECA